MATTNLKKPMIINIEGNDGTGKATVCAALKEKCEERGYSTKLVSFPDYESDTGKLVSSFLNGDLYQYSPCDVDAYKGSIPYAMDRLRYYAEHPDTFMNADVIICDRSYMANYFYQASKLCQAVDGEYSRGDLTCLCKWIHAMVQLEIVNTDLAGNHNILNFYIEAESVHANIEKMRSRGRPLDKNEQDIDYLMSVENFALTSPMTKFWRIPESDFAKIARAEDTYDFLPYYMYRTFKLYNGNTPEQINGYVGAVAHSIYTLINRVIINDQRK